MFEFASEHLAQHARFLDIQSAELRAIASADPCERGDNKRRADACRDHARELRVVAANLDAIQRVVSVPMPEDSGDMAEEVAEQ